MLKIKDNINLKELEKFGFKINDEEWYEQTISNGYALIKPISRKIVIHPYSIAKEGKLDFIYNLIQAGLVEKVEE